jgi:hypothetical protein
MIISCSAFDIDDMHTVYVCTLQHIGIDQYFEGFIRTWCGTDLCVIDCPGFNDDVLEMMGQPDEYGDFYGDGMEGLDIQHCDHFSVEALKKMVEIRGSNPREEGRLLTPNVHARFPLSEEDMHWFSGKVKHFWWQDTTGE